MYFNSLNNCMTTVVVIGYNVTGQIPVNGNSITSIEKSKQEYLKITGKVCIMGLLFTISRKYLLFAA